MPSPLARTSAVLRLLTPRPHLSSRGLNKLLISALVLLYLAAAAKTFARPQLLLREARPPPPPLHHASHENGEQQQLRLQQKALRRRLDQEPLLLEQQLGELKQQLQEQLQQQKQKQQLQQQEQLVQQQQEQEQLVQLPQQQDQQQQRAGQQQQTTPDEPLMIQEILTIANMSSCQPKDFENLPYQGYECHISNIWPDGLCPIDGSCLPACSRCLHWRRGRVFFDQDITPGTFVGWHSGNRADGGRPEGGKARVEEHVAQEEMLRCDSTIWGFGSWVGETWLLSRSYPQWMPSQIYPQCGNGSSLSPGDIYRCLKGRRVAFFGDSMIRPLMGRLIAYLRGIPQYIDHLYHYPGGYYMTNGTHDVFVENSFLPSLHSGLRAVHPGHQAPVTPEDGWDPRVTLEMQMFWAPHFAKYELDGRSYPSLSQHLLALDGSDVMIAGPMFHDYSLYDSFREELLSYFRHLSRHGKRVKLFFWVATLPHDNQHVERNAHMRAFVEALNQQALSGNTAVPRMSYFVDVARMSATSPAKTVDLHHYQCNKHGIFPVPLTNNLEGIAADKDCRDIFNLNVIQTILKVVCISG